MPESLNVNFWSLFFDKTLHIGHVAGIDRTGDVPLMFSWIQVWAMTGPFQKPSFSFNFSKILPDFIWPEHIFPPFWETSCMLMQNVAKFDQIQPDFFCVKWRLLSCSLAPYSKCMNITVWMWLSSHAVHSQYLLEIPATITNVVGRPIMNDSGLFFLNNRNNGIFNWVVKAFFYTHCTLKRKRKKYFIEKRPRGMQ